jgi:hypothetical protein
VGNTTSGLTLNVSVLSTFGLQHDPTRSTRQIEFYLRAIARAAEDRRRSVRSLSGSRVVVVLGNAVIVRWQTRVARPRAAISKTSVIIAAAVRRKAGINKISGVHCRINLHIVAAAAAALRNVNSSE